MTEQQPGSSVSAAFPAPPPFYKDFTEENLERLKQIKEEHSIPEESANTAALLRSLDLPKELQNLVPPRPPTSGKYRVFGEEHDINASIPPLHPETPQLYSSPPTPAALLILIRSLMLNFLELTQILATNPGPPPGAPPETPAAWATKWDDLRDLFRNIHQAVNEYRPFQARESLIELLEEQIRRSREEVKGVKELREKVEGVLGNLEKKPGINESREISDGNTGIKLKQVMDEKFDDEKMVWEVLERELG